MNFYVLASHLHITDLLPSTPFPSVTEGDYQCHFTTDMLQQTARGTAVNARLLQLCGHFKG